MLLFLVAFEICLYFRNLGWIGQAIGTCEPWCIQNVNNLIMYQNISWPFIISVVSLVGLGTMQSELIFKEKGVF